MAAPAEVEPRVGKGGADAAGLRTAPAFGPGEDTSIDQWRRQVSVIAIEIISPIEGLPHGDPETDFGVVASARQIISRELQHHGGVIISSSDTSVVGLFGVGAITEDHAVQSSKAALALGRLDQIPGRERRRIAYRP